MHLFYKRFASKALGTKGDKMLELGRRCLDSQNFVWVSIDFEWWEQSPNKITEIGISILNCRPEKKTFIPPIQSFHLLPDPAYKKVNGRYVPNHRDYFAFGVPRIMRLLDCRIFLQSVLEKFRHEQLFLVGHHLHNDLRHLKGLGIETEDLPPILDTMEIAIHLWGRPIALGDFCRFMRVDAGLLHNAGNDARATLILLAQLCDRNFDEPKMLPKTTMDKAKRKIAQRAGYRKRDSPENLIRTVHI